MFCTGPLSQGTMQSMSSVMMKISKTAPLWPTSSLQPVTFSLRRSVLWCLAIMIVHSIGIINNCGTESHVFMQVKCYGPGLEPTGCIVNKPAEFTIDARGAGRGQLQIYAQVHFHTSPKCLMPHASLHWCKNLFVLLLFKDSEGFPINIQITDNGDSTYFCVYIPIKPIKHTIIITWGEVNVPNSPFRVRAHCQQGKFQPADDIFIVLFVKNVHELVLPFNESS